MKFNDSDEKEKVKAEVGVKFETSLENLFKSTIKLNIKEDQEEEEEDCPFEEESPVLSIKFKRKTDAKGLKFNKNT